MTTARFTGARLLPGTSTAVTSNVAKTSLVPGNTYGCDRRPVIDSDPGCASGGLMKGSGAGGFCGGGFGTGVATCAMGSPMTTARINKTAADARKRKVRFIETLQRVAV